MADLKISHPFFRRVYKNIPQPPRLGHFFWVDTYTYLGTNRWERCPSPVDIWWLQPWTPKPGWVGFSVIHPYPYLQKKIFDTIIVYIYMYVYKYSAYIYTYIYISLPTFAVKNDRNFWRRHSKSILSKEHVPSTFILSILPGVLGGHYKIHGMKKVCKKPNKKTSRTWKWVPGPKKGTIL